LIADSEHVNHVPDNSDDTRSSPFRTKCLSTRPVRRQWISQDATPPVSAIGPLLCSLVGSGPWWDTQRGIVYENRHFSSHSSRAPNYQILKVTIIGIFVGLMRRILPWCQQVSFVSHTSNWSDLRFLTCNGSDPYQLQGLCNLDNTIRCRSCRLHLQIRVSQ